jgi:hypothetical protein
MLLFFITRKYTIIGLLELASMLGNKPSAIYEPTREFLYIARFGKESS